MDKIKLISNINVDKTSGAIAKLHCMFKFLCKYIEIESKTKQIYIAAKEKETLASLMERKRGESFLCNRFSIYFFSIR